MTSSDSPCHPGQPCCSLWKHHFSNCSLGRLCFSRLSSTSLLPEQQAAFPFDKSGHPKYGAWSKQEHWPHAALISKCRFELRCYFGGLVSFHTQWFSVGGEGSWQGKVLGGEIYLGVFVSETLAFKKITWWSHNKGTFGIASPRHWLAVSMSNSEVLGARWLSR